MYQRLNLYIANNLLFLGQKGETQEKKRLTAGVLNFFFFWGSILVFKKTSKKKKK
jgi:hypothetical protein